MIALPLNFLSSTLTDLMWDLRVSVDCIPSADQAGVKQFKIISPSLV